jgi:hypothetical protein
MALLDLPLEINKGQTNVGLSLLYIVGSLKTSPHVKKHIQLHDKPHHFSSNSPTNQTFD